MQLVQDKDLEGAVGTLYGKYLGTFHSARGQVRADFFDDGLDVVAHVSFPTGLSPATIQERYLSALQAYAQSHGFFDRFRINFS